MSERVCVFERERVSEGVRGRKKTIDRSVMKKLVFHPSILIIINY